MDEPFDNNPSPYPTDRLRPHRARGYLPHIDRPGLRQLVTFNLADALTPGLIEERLRELQTADATSNRNRADDDRRRDVMHQLLDEGRGSRLLAEPEIARITESAVTHFHTIRYDLFAWVVMPNHVHVLLSRRPGTSLGAIVGSWKRRIDLEVRRIRPGLDRSWQREFHDRFIRDDRHYETAIVYIEANPVRAHLCERPVDWLFSSARRRDEFGRLVINPVVRP